MNVDEYRHRGFQCLCGNLRMAARALTTMYDEALERTGISVTQLTVLWCVLAAEPVAMTDIARIVVMDKTTVTRSVASLAARRLVRVGKGRDARHRLVSSTSRGRGAFERAMPAWHAAQAKAARLLGEREAVRLTRKAREVARTVARETA